MPGPCAPDFGDQNPCRDQDASLFREMGLPGPPGAPGTTPAFVIGSVTEGAVPSVTLTKVNPLLYRMDFIIPQTGVNQTNTWTATQTYNATSNFNELATFTGGITTNTLTVSGPAIFNGASTFGGAVTFESSATFLGGITTNTLTTTGDVNVGGQLITTGDITDSAIAQLGAGIAIRGTVVADSCGKLFYINGTGPNSNAVSSALALTIAYNAAEGSVGVTLPFTVPNLAPCGTAMNANVNLFGRITSAAGGALPTDISAFLMLVRLDNSSSGTILASASITNFEKQALWNVNASIAPGPHTLYFTVQGLGVGTSSITLAEIDASINF